MSDVVTLVVSTRLHRSLLRRMDLGRFWHVCYQRYHQRSFFLSLIPTVMTTSKMRHNPRRINELERSQQVTTEVTTSAAAAFLSKVDAN
jgi:hypothetical protein